MSNSYQMNGNVNIASESTCILAITGAYHSTGGIAAVNRLVLRAFGEKAWRCEVYVLNELNDVQLPEGVDGLINGYYPFNGNKRAFIQSLWQGLVRKPEAIVFCDHVNLAASLAPFRLLLGTRYIVWMHGIEMMPPKPNLEGRIGLQGAWKCLCSSQYTFLQVKKTFPNLSLTTCDLALNRDFLSVSPEKPNESDPIYIKCVDGYLQELSHKVILHVGRMSAIQRHKGHEILIAAFPGVHEHHPEAQLVLVGDGDDHSYLLDLVRKFPHSIKKQIFLPGYLSDEMLTRIYQNCFVFAMPSMAEGFGIVYIEAMSHGKPCIGSKFDAARYVIRDGETGLLVNDPKSPIELTEKICWLMERPKVAQDMGMDGYELVRLKYLFPHFRERFWKALMD